MTEGVMRHVASDRAPCNRKFEHHYNASFADIATLEALCASHSVLRDQSAAFSRRCLDRNPIREMRNGSLSGKFVSMSEQAGRPSHGERSFLPTSRTSGDY
jgi:hypothetical protein